MKENEKQAIEEMDKDIGEAIMHNSVVDIINGGFIGVNSEGMARELFDDGYRKQVEGEWETTLCNAGADTFNFYSHICKVKGCGYFYKDVRPYGYKFCPNCGAKMKGAE